VEDLDRSEGVPAEQCHSPVRIDDDGGTVQRRRDHERVLEMDALKDTPPVGAERDGEDLVRGLRADKRDRSLRGGCDGCGGNEEK
jgi:hypothetical protein